MKQHIELHTTNNQLRRFSFQNPEKSLQEIWYNPKQWKSFQADEVEKSQYNVKELNAVRDKEFFTAHVKEFSYFHRKMSSNPKNIFVVTVAIHTLDLALLKIRVVINVERWDIMPSVANKKCIFQRRNKRVKYFSKNKTQNFVMNVDKTVQLMEWLPLIHRTLICMMNIYLM